MSPAWSPLDSGVAMCRVYGGFFIPGQVVACLGPEDGRLSRHRSSCHSGAWFRAEFLVSRSFPNCALRTDTWKSLPHETMVLAAPQ